MSKKRNMGVFQLHMYKLRKCQIDSDSMNECLKAKMCNWLRNSFLHAFNTDLEDARSFVGVFSLTTKDLWQDINSIKCDICPTLATFKQRKDKKWHHNQEKEIDALRFVQLTVELYNYLNCEVDLKKVAELTRRTVQQYRKFEEEEMGEELSRMMRPAPSPDSEVNPDSETEDQGGGCTPHRHIDSPQSESSYSTDSGNEYCEHFPGLPSHKGPSHLGHSVKKIALSEPTLTSNRCQIGSSDSVWYKCKDKTERLNGVDKLYKDHNQREQQTENSNSFQRENDQSVYLDCLQDGAIICSTYNELRTHLAELALKKNEGCRECDVIETEDILSSHRRYNVFGHVGERPSPDSIHCKQQAGDYMSCTEAFLSDISDATSSWSVFVPSLPDEQTQDKHSSSMHRLTCIQKLLQIPKLLPYQFPCLFEGLASPLTCVHGLLECPYLGLPDQLPSVTKGPVTPLSPFLVSLGTSDSLFCGMPYSTDLPGSASDFTFKSEPSEVNSVSQHFPAIPRRMPVLLVQEATLQQTEKMKENTFMAISAELKEENYQDHDANGEASEQPFVETFEESTEFENVELVTDEPPDCLEQLFSVLSEDLDSQNQPVELEESFVKVDVISSADLQREMNSSKEGLPRCQYFNNDDDEQIYCQQDIMLSSCNWAKVRAFHSQQAASDFGYNSLLSLEEAIGEAGKMEVDAEPHAFKFNTPGSCLCGGSHEKWQHHSVPKYKYWKDPIVSCFMLAVCKDYYEVDPEFFGPFLDMELEMASLLMPEGETCMSMQFEEQVPPMPCGLSCEEIERDAFATLRNRLEQPKLKGRRPFHPNKPCSFYMEGSCYRSDCKYSHDLSTITCHFWKEGQCFKGDLCPFLHGYNKRRSKGDSFSKHKFSTSIRSVGLNLKKNCPQQSRRETSSSGLLALKKMKINKKIILLHNKTACISREN